MLRLWTSHKEPTIQKLQWKGGTSDWVRLADLKESFPLEVAEYTQANRIDDEPAFAW